MLAEAPCLEVLDLSGNVGLELSMHDVRATLMRMPRLALLLLGKQAAYPGAVRAPLGSTGLEWRTPSVAALVALAQALPHLQVGREEERGVGGAGRCCPTAWGGAVQLASWVGLL